MKEYSYVTLVKEELNLPLQIYKTVNAWLTVSLITLVNQKHILNGLWDIATNFGRFSGADFKITKMN